MPSQFHFVPSAPKDLERVCCERGLDDHAGGPNFTTLMTRSSEYDCWADVMIGRHRRPQLVV